MAKTRKIIPTFIIASAILVTLTGCQSAESFNAYVDTIDALDGVKASGGISTPLPWSVQGTLHLGIEPNYLTYQKALTAACKTPVDASVSLDIEVKTENNTVRGDLFGNCVKPVINLVKMSNEIKASGMQNVNAEVSYDGSVTFSSLVKDEDITTANSFALLKIAALLLPANAEINLRSDSFQVKGVSQAEANRYLPGLEAILQVNKVEVKQIIMDKDSLFIQLPETGTQEQQTSLENDIKFLLPEYASTTQINIDNGVIISAKVPESVIALTTYIKSTGIAYSITANEDNARMTVNDINNIVPLSELIAKNNPDNIPVLISYYNKDKLDVVYLQIESPHQVNLNKNDYIGIMDKYNELVETGDVKFINFDSNGLAVEVNENIEPKSKNWNKVAALLHKYDETEHYSFISMNTTTID